MKPLLILLLFSGWIGSAHAVSLEFSPNFQQVSIGQTTMVDVVVSGLGDFMPRSVGAYDLDISYDPTILSASGVTFGTDLGDGFSTSFQGFDLFSIPGVVNFFEISFLSSFELDVFQPGEFILATLSFDTLAVGSSPLIFSPTVVADALGDNINLRQSSPGSVDTVPEPATAILLGSGLAGLAMWRWKNERRSKNS